MKDLLTEDDLVSLHFQEHETGGYRLRIPPENEWECPVAILAVPHVGGWTISLLQRMAVGLDIQEDHVVLTSVPRELSKERFMKLLEVLGVTP